MKFNLFAFSHILIMRRQSSNLLAENGFLGFPMNFGDEDMSYGRWKDEWKKGTEGPDYEALNRRIFYATHQRPSLEQMGIFQTYTKEFSEIDEDGGNTNVS